MADPWQELATGVYRRRYPSLDLNVGVVVGHRGVVVVDTRASHRQAQELRAELARLTDRPVGWVVNTHWHWDHVWGNALFPEARIWGHDRCRAVMQEHGEEHRTSVLDSLPEEHHADIRAVEITPPAHTFADLAFLDLGDRGVALTHHGRGHTDADIVVTVTDAPVAFVGDLVEEGAPPSFEDSYPLDWPKTLASVLAVEPEVVVPGHGDVVDLDFARRQHAVISAAAERAADAFAAGSPLESLDTGAGPFPAPVLATLYARAYHQLGSSTTGRRAEY